MAITEAYEEIRFPRASGLVAAAAAADCRRPFGHRFGSVRATGMEANWTPWQAVSGSGIRITRRR